MSFNKNKTSRVNILSNVGVEESVSDNKILLQQAD